MTQYLVITVPGIGEQSSPTPWGMLANLTDHLPATKFASVQFNWQNTYGPVPSWDGAAYETNKSAAVSALVARVEKELDSQERSIVLVGYSGGAQVASEALAILANRHFEDWALLKRLPAAVMVANPVRLHTDSRVSKDVRYGLAGKHALFPPKTHLIDVANPRDGICATPPPPHPLRGFTDLSKRFSLMDPVTWGVETFQAVSTGQWQNGYNFSTAQAWWDAVALLRGYIYDGQHTSYYVPKLPAIAAQLDRYLP